MLYPMIRPVDFAPKQFIRPEGFFSVKKSYRWLVILLGYLFLLTYWNQSQNGRYIPHDSAEGLVVVDSRTGEIAWPDMDKIWKPFTKKP